jgi:hypothetical protein
MRCPANTGINPVNHSNTAKNVAVSSLFFREAAIFRVDGDSGIPQCATCGEAAPPTRCRT